MHQTLFYLIFLLDYISGTHWYNDKTYRLPQREAVQDGYMREIKLDLGKKHILKTLSVNPPIFEVENFITYEECEYLIYLAKNEGLEQSPTHPELSNFDTTHKVFDEWDTNNDSYIEPIEFTYIKGKGDLYLTELEVMKMMDKLNMDKNHDNKIEFSEFSITTAEKVKDYFIYLYRTKPHLRSRFSNQAWLWHYGVYDELLEGFHERLSRLTLLPHDLIEMSEPMQIVHYEEGGHYHCHHDSDEIDSTLPCCTYENQNKSSCRLCRFLTVMLFLNNVTYGGETAFQVAGNETFSSENWENEAVRKCNLVDNCDESNLIIQPVKGTAIFWYNHEIDQSTGWLGDLHKMTYHGGCDVTDHDKWIANMWINVIGEKGSHDSYNGWLGMRMADAKTEL